MSWSSKRRFTYASILAAGFLFVAFLLIYPSVSKAPTCVDGKQNGDEVGIDCGGSCINFCPSEVAPLRVLWQRAFPVTGSVYSLLAYVENQNATAMIDRVPYEFRLYDADNQFITLRDGETYITPNGRMAIFEAGVNVGNRPPRRVTFEFLNKNPTWTKVDAEKLKSVKLTTKDVLVADTDSTPRLTATMQNNTIYDIPQVDVFAILYDSEENAIAVSKSLFSPVGKNSETPLIFTWPEPFDRTVARTEIIPKFDVNTISF